MYGTCTGQYGTALDVLADPLKPAPQDLQSLYGTCTGQYGTVRDSTGLYGTALDVLADTLKPAPQDLQSLYGTCTGQYGTVRDSIGHRRRVARDSSTRSADPVRDKYGTVRGSALSAVLTPQPFLSSPT